MGYPQLSAVLECADAAHGLKGHIISVCIHTDIVFLQCSDRKQQKGLKKKPVPMTVIYFFFTDDS